MLRVPTYLARSTIHGYGVFSSAPIARGAVIWEYDDGMDWKLSEEEMATLPDSLKPQLNAWTYRADDGSYVLCSDSAKFMNHSSEPNCHDPQDYLTVAARDIAAGEELTCDYCAFDATSKKNGQSEFHGAA